MKSCEICCGGELVKKLETQDMLYGHPGNFTIWECQNCKSQQLLPQPTAEHLSRLYESDTYYSYGQQRIPTPMKMLREWTRRLVPKVLQNKSFLDFGCGDGEVLRVADKKGARVYGIELGEVAAVLSKETGFDIHNSFADFKDQKFDFIRSFHSLEHVPDPGQSLRQFKKYLAPTGTVLIGVPNTRGTTARLFRRYWYYRGAPLHTFGYSPEGLIELAKINGLRCSAFRTHQTFRGILGSTLIFLSNKTKGKSREPSTKIFFLLFPAIIILSPLSFILNILKLGDCMELEFQHE